ncbi:MAG: hypothetical protein ACI4MQ_06015 [Candidatus Coproplasma sp.]
MNISEDLLEKAKTAKTAEELLAMAKEENIELTAEQAAKAFAELNKTGELADEELDNVAGGASCMFPEYKYNVGETVYIYGSDVIYRITSRYLSAQKKLCYALEEKYDTSKTTAVFESSIKERVNSYRSDMGY